MARQTINIGTSANKGDGDPLRTAFDKVNDNFAELYAGNNVDPSNTAANLVPDADGTRDLGSSTKRWADVYIKDFIYLNGSRIEVDANGNLLIDGVEPRNVTDIQGSVFADDSTLLVDGVNNSINLDGTVKGDIVPDIDVAYDLGSATKRFRDLYLSGSTIDLGGTTLSVVGGELQLGGVKIPTQTDLDSAVSAPTGDLTGSVFADDSTLLVDGVNGRLVGPVATENISHPANDGLGLRLNSTDQSTLMVAKQSFNRRFEEDIDVGYTLSMLNSPNRVRVTFDTNNGLYFRGLLERWTNLYETIGFGDPVSFEYDYSNIRLSLVPDTYDIVTNVVGVTFVSDNVYDIEIDQDPITVLFDAGAEAGELSQIALLYDYNNTMGFDVERNRYGIAVDHDDIDLRAGRDIDLDAVDDFRVRAGSAFNLTLVRNDDQYDDAGININLWNNGGINSEDIESWTFQFDGSLRFPDNTIQTTAYTGYHTGDMTGSVFADDSTLLVDGVAGKIVGDIVSTNWTTDSSVDINITSGEDINLTASDDINLETTGDTGDIRLRSKNIAYIATNWDSDFFEGEQWTFGADGNLDAPGGISLDGTLTVEESFSSTPTTKFFEIETGAGNNRLLRTGVNMSAFAQNIGPEIDLTSYRSSPANGDAGPGFVLRASTLTSVNDVIATIVTEVTDVSAGNVTSKILFATKHNGSYVTPFTIAGSTVDMQTADQVSISNENGAVDIYGGVEFNNGTTAFQAGNSVTFNTSVDFNGVVNFDDATIDWAPIVSGVLINNGLPVLPTQTLDINGSVFADDSTLLVDGVNGSIPYSVISGLPNNAGVAYQYGYSAHDAESTAGNDFTVDSVTMIISLTATANAQGARIDISGITTNSSAGTGLIYVQRRVNSGSWTLWNAFVVDGAGDHISHSFVDFYETGGTSFDISAGDTVEYKLFNGTNIPDYAGNSSGDVDFELFFGFQFTATEIPVSYSLTQP